MPSVKTLKADETNIVRHTERDRLTSSVEGPVVRSCVLAVDFG